ncbi:MAG: S-layer homology domain-containing protein [bacterium]|nr:S-layer homology domain-containing protein [bacterium]
MLLAAWGGGFVGYYSALIDLDTYRSSRAYQVEIVDQQIKQLDREIAGLESSVERKETILNETFVPHDGASLKSQVLQRQDTQEAVMTETARSQELRDKRDELRTQKVALESGQPIEYKPAAAISPFSDVISGQMEQEVFDAIVGLKTNGITTGVNGQFKPNDFLNRAEAVTFLLRAFYPDFDASQLNVSTSPFTDVSSSDWFFTAFWFAHQSTYHGQVKPVIVKGSNGLANPSGNVTVEEFIAMILRVMEIPVQETSPWYSEYIFWGVDLGIIRDSDRLLIGMPIPRSVVARILWKAIQVNQEKQAETSSPAVLTPPPLKLTAEEPAPTLVGTFTTLTQKIAERRDIEIAKRDAGAFFQEHTLVPPASVSVSASGGMVTDLQLSMIAYALSLMPADFPSGVKITLVYNDPNMRNGIASVWRLMLKASMFTEKPETAFEVILHELGHVYSLKDPLTGGAGSPYYLGSQALPSNSPTAEFFSLGWNDIYSPKSEPLTTYGGTLSFEEYAEAFIAYIVQNEWFQTFGNKDASIAQKYEFMKQRFGGKTFTTFIDYVTKPYAIQSLTFDPFAYFDAN